MMVESLGANDWIPVEEQHWIAQQEQIEGAAQLVVVETWNLGGQFATFSHLREPRGEVKTQCRFNGTYRGRGYPIHIREVAVAHALEVANRCPDIEDKIASSYVVVRIGNQEPHEDLIEWIVKGKLHLRSALAPLLVRSLNREVGELYCAITLCGVPDGFSENAKFTGARRRGVICGAANRIFAKVS